MQNVDVTNECKTVVDASSEIGNLLFYRGVCLSYIEYTEDPKDIEDMSVSFDQTSDGGYDLNIKCPIINANGFDVSNTFSLTEAEFDRFQRKSYDPLCRGVYPLQSKIDEGYVLDVSHILREFESRIYVDKVLLELLLQAGSQENDGANVFEDVFKQISVEFAEMQSEEKCTRFVELYKLQFAIKRYEDFIGDVFVVEMSTIPLQTKVACEVLYQPETKEYYITINGNVADAYSPVDAEDSKGLSSPYMRVPNIVLDRMVPNKCFEVAFHKAGKMPNAEIDGITIARNQSALGYHIPKDCIRLNKSRVAISEIPWFGLIDYRFLISEHVPKTRYDKIERMGYYTDSDGGMYLIGQ